MRRWTDRELSFLRENYYILGAGAIASLLQRSRASVVAKVHYLKKCGWSFRVNNS